MISLPIDSLNFIIQPSNIEATNCLLKLGFQPIPAIPQLLYQYVTKRHLKAIFRHLTKAFSSNEQAACRFLMTRSPSDCSNLLLEFLKAQPLISITKSVKYSWFFQILAKERLFFEYQPIFDLLNGELIGHECLARALDNQERYYTGQQLIDAALATQLTNEFDELARSTCLESIAAHNNDLKFFINIVPNALIRDAQVIERNLKRVLDLGLRPQQIIFELTEIEALGQTYSLHQIINRIKEWGFLIAVDDLCSCTSMDNYFLEFRPDIVKIDRRLVHGCSRHTLKQILLKSTLDAAHQSGILVVAEGLEALEDINFCRDLGVDMGQGFGLGRPARNLWQKSLDLLSCPVSLAS